MVKDLAGNLNSRVGIDGVVNSIAWGMAAGAVEAKYESFEEDLAGIGGVDIYNIWRIMELVKRYFPAEDELKRQKAER